MDPKRVKRQVKNRAHPGSNSGVSALPFSIPPNHKFACLAFEEMYRCDLTSRCQIRPGLSIELEPPVDLDDQWLRWLGEINADRLRKARFLIVATRHSAAPGTVDHEGEGKKLRELVHRFRLALSLQGIFHASGILSVGTRTV